MPRYFIIIAVVVIVILVSAVRLAVKAAGSHFVCPECGASFQISFVRYFFTVHGFDGKISCTCPKCKRTNMLEPISGKE